MPFIRECIVTTIREDKTVHIAPMGIHEEGEHLIILPFKPSATLDNLERNSTATLNYTNDVRVYAGCLTGHRDWDTCSTDVINGVRLKNCLSHTELEVIDKVEDELRPKYICKVVHEATHQPFHGYNRAQSAVLELAILTSRLHMLPKDKVQQEIEYLSIGYEKTSGPREQEAWTWLMKKIDVHFKKESQT
jgi:hypothetical protein